MIAINTNQLAAISRLFSSGVFRELSRKGRSPVFARLARECACLDEMSARAKVRDLFDAAFDVLKQTMHRHEYVYKAALTRNILLGKHSLQTASMLTEFRVGDCKADLAILNGTATVYEIKSERDSLTRLERQVRAYESVFARVYVIAGENHVDDVFKTVPRDVGVMMLTNRQSIRTLREALNRPERTSSLAMFDSIRSSEAQQILSVLDIQMPRVPNTQVRAAMRKLFSALPPSDVQTAMVKVLKKTRNLMPLADLVDELPSSLTTAALTFPLRRSDHARLVAAVNARLTTAARWS